MTAEKSVVAGMWNDVLSIPRMWEWARNSFYSVSGSCFYLRAFINRTNDDRLADESSDLIQLSLEIKLRFLTFIDPVLRTSRKKSTTSVNFIRVWSEWSPIMIPRRTSWLSVAKLRTKRRVNRIIRNKTRYVCAYRHSNIAVSLL